MKKFIFGFFSLVFSSIFAVNLVNWDIIDPNWNYRESEDILSATREMEELIEKRSDVIYYDKYECWNCGEYDTFKDFYYFWWDLEDLQLIFLKFLCFLLLLLVVSALFLYRVFEKLWEKWWKAFIPIKNLYCLINLTDTRKIGMFWRILGIWWFFLISLLYYCFYPFVGFYLSYYEKWFLDIFFQQISFFPVVIVLLVYDYFVLISFYRLFRKFGWNKWYSVLWTIFFPIWVCVLWFGNFEYQWENLEKKEWNN